MENRTLNKEITAIKDAYLKGHLVPDKEIAEASFTVLDEYRWLSDPTPPDKVKEYFGLKVEQRKKMNTNPSDYAPFWTDPVVKHYFDERLKIRHKNETNQRWLEWMAEILAEDSDKITAINLKLYQFSDDYLKTIGYVKQPDWNE